MLKTRLTGKYYNKYEVVFIGGSIDDYDAVVKNGTDFHGYNNKRLLNPSELYIIILCNIIKTQIINKLKNI